MFQTTNQENIIWLAYLQTCSTTRRAKLYCIYPVATDFGHGYLNKLQIFFATRMETRYSLPSAHMKYFRQGIFPHVYSGLNSISSSISRGKKHNCHDEPRGSNLSRNGWIGASQIGESTNMAMPCWRKITSVGGLWVVIEVKSGCYFMWHFCIVDQHKCNGSNWWEWVKHRYTKALCWTCFMEC